MRAVTAEGRGQSAWRLIAGVCAAQMVGHVSAYAVPALLPLLMRAWGLSGGEAGFLAGIYYGGYTLAVPFLVSLTDRIDPRRIYLLSTALTGLACLGLALLAEGLWSAALFWGLAGAGFAGCYMPGLRVLTDATAGRTRSRAVAFYTSCLGVGSSLSFLAAAGIAAWLGWRWAFAAGALGALLGIILAASIMPPRSAPATAPRPWRSVLDPRPALRNRAAMAYTIGYTVHSWELFTLRAWSVAFLTAMAPPALAAHPLLGPVAVTALMGFCTMPASVAGNELCLRFGRRRIITAVMAGSIVMALLTATLGTASYLAAALLVLLYCLVVYGDSSALTAGAVGNARPGEAGASMAVHSTLGFAGGFLGPFAFGAILDAAGGGRLAWPWPSPISPS
ncbi:MFS transporter [Geminicoccaceae bacterium 1502E]|nr:MFS transporter [Geminicoccaceae bacterium 1502E]